MDTDVQKYDYESLGDLAGPIEGIAKRIRTRMKRSVEDLIVIGQELTSAKGLLKGGFHDWIETEFDWSEATAYRFMRVADRFGESCQIDRVAPSVLYMLSSPDVSDAVVAEVLDVAATTGKVTVAQAREIIEAAEEDEPEAEAEEATEDAEPVFLTPEKNETRPATDPHGRIAPLWNAIGGSIDSVRERFEANAQECNERESFLIHWAAARKAYDKYVERNESQYRA